MKQGINSSFARMIVLFAFVLVLFTSNVWAQIPEGFEGGQIPTGWTVYNQDGDAYQWEAYQANAEAHSGTWMARVHYHAPACDDWLVTPQLQVTSDHKVLSFWGRSTSGSFAEDFNVKISTTTNAVASFTTTAASYMQIPNAWTKYTVDLTSYVGQNVYVAVQCISQDEWYLAVDDFDWVTGNDLAGASLTGNTAPTVNAATPYTITVANNGTAAQSAYTVKLMSGTTVLGTAAGVAVAPGATATVVINWTPTAVGVVTLTGKVELTGDTNAANDVTPALAVNVQGTGTVAVTVGDGTTTTNTLPIDFYYKSSLTETMYYPDEITSGGLITAIQYYYSFPEESLTNQALKVYMGTTTEADLSAGWVPSSSLTTVFNGTVNTPQGEGNINIPLTTPFPYGGGNLVVMIERPLDTAYYEQTDVFYYLDTANHANRTRDYHNDTTPADPTAPPTATPSTKCPKTTFFFNTAGLATVTGVVTKTTNNTPVAGVLVEVVGTQRSAVTNEAGQYTMQYLNPGTVSLKVSKHAYFDSTYANVTLVADQSTTKNMAIRPNPAVAVTGHVLASDTNQPVSAAAVTLTGFEPFETTTNATGDFSFPAVFGGHDYTLTITKQGYATYTQTITVGVTALVVPTITILEQALPVGSVTATANGNTANIIWTRPGAGGPEGQLEEGFEGTEFPPTGWTLADADGDTYNWILNPNAAAQHGGEQCAASESYDNAVGALTPDNYLITPFIHINSSDAHVTYWMGAQDASWFSEHYSIMVSTTGTAPADFEEVFGETLDTGAWTEKTVSLEEYAGTNVYLAFRHHDVTDQYWIKLDDISITAGVIETRNAGLMTAKNAIAPSKPAFVATVCAAPFKNVANTTVTSIRKATPQRNNDRSIVSYIVYRLIQGQAPAQWTTLTTQNAPDTTYDDTNWGTLPAGLYQYAVKAVYTNNVNATAKLSNVLPKDMTTTVTAHVTTNSNDAATGAIVTITNADGIAEHVYTGTYPATGDLVMNNVWKGTYSVHVTKAGYNPYDQASVSVQQPVTINANLVEIKLPAENLQATVAGGTVNLTWLAPGSGTPMWLTWAAEEYNDAIGTGGAADFDVAQRFEPADLGDVDGMYLTKVKFYPNEAAATYTVKVWTGGSATDAGTLVCEQAVPDAQIGAWNEVVLTTPVLITGTEELWFGYNVNTTTGYPAGVDAGPQLEGKGNMMYYEGAWSTLAQISASLTYNWLIQGYADYSSRSDVAKTIAPVVDRHFTGYQLKRDNVITYEGTATSYTDTNVPHGTHQYLLYAVYSSGNSEPISALVNVTGNEDPVVAVTALGTNYPNPFNPETSISFSNATEGPVLVEIYNLKGQKVRTLVNEVMAAGNHSVVWKGLDDNNKPVSSGVYFFNMKSGKYSATRKMILMK